MIGGVCRGRPCWENVIYWRFVGLDRIAAERIEDVIMAEVLRWWEQRKELVF